MSIEFVLRLIGMVVLAVGGWQLGTYLSSHLAGATDGSIRYVLILSLSGAALGLLLTPRFTTKPLNALRRRIQESPPQRLLAIFAGLKTRLKDDSVVGRQCDYGVFGICFQRLANHHAGLGRGVGVIQALDLGYDRAGAGKLLVGVVELV